MHHFPTSVKTQRFFLLQNFVASSDRGNAWYFQAWDIRTYARVLHAEDVLILKFDRTRSQAMPPFYANALEACHMNTIVNPNIQSIADLRRTPVRNSTLLTPHISGHTLVFDEAWATLNVFYAGDLLMENGHWKHIEVINRDRCAITTIHRLAANLKTAEDLLRHHYPNLSLQFNSLTTPSTSFAIKQPNGKLTSLLMPRKTIYTKFFLLTVLGSSVFSE